MKYIISVIVIIAVFVIWAMTPHGNKTLSCWAYYDQCMSKRIEGITKEECLKKEGVVAWLIADKICLVKRKEN